MGGGVGVGGFLWQGHNSVVISNALSVAAAEVVILAAGPGLSDRALCQMTSLVMSEWRWGGAGWEEGGM